MIPPTNSELKHRQALRAAQADPSLARASIATPADVRSPARPPPPSPPPTPDACARLPLGMPSVTHYHMFPHQASVAVVPAGSYSLACTWLWLRMAVSARCRR